MHAFLRRPWVFSRALGCGARRGVACTPRRKFGSRAGSMARVLGVRSREIWKVITALLSAELEPSKTLKSPNVSHCCKAQQHGNNNRYKLSSALQLRTLLLCVCGPMLYICVMMYVCMRCVCAPCTCACVHGSVHDAC